MKYQAGNLIEIDGSYGEGGGQILRTALAFSVILKRPIRIHHIRAGRKNPGLRPQHLKAVEALTLMADGRTEGAHIGSDTLTFVPQKISPGDYKFEVGTAGSVTLLLQALLLPLCLSQEDSKITLVGGTHVPWSPPFHYLKEVLFPSLNLMGISIEANIDRWGWYPKGGGIVHVEIKPGQELRPVSWMNRGSLKRIYGLSATSHLPRHVGERQKDFALRRIKKELDFDAEIQVLYDAPGSGPGSFFFLVAESEGAIAGFSALGERGKRGEEVAQEALDSLEEYVESEGCMDPHLADQLIPFLSLARGDSSLTTTRMTEHLLTNLWVVQHFLALKFSRQGEKGEKGKIEFFNE